MPRIYWSLYEPFWLQTEWELPYHGVHFKQQKLMRFSNWCTHFLNVSPSWNQSYVEHSVVVVPISCEIYNPCIPILYLSNFWYHFQFLGRGKSCVSLRELLIFGLLMGKVTTSFPPHQLPFPKELGLWFHMAVVHNSILKEAIDEELSLTKSVAEIWGWKLWWMMIDDILPKKNMCMHIYYQNTHIYIYIYICIYIYIYMYTGYILYMQNVHNKTNFHAPFLA